MTTRGEEGKEPKEEREELSELEKFKLMASQAGIDAGKLFQEIADSVEKSITPKVVASVNQVLAGIDSNLGKIIADRVKPMVEPMVESAVVEKLPGMMEQVGTELLGRYQKAGAGQNGGQVGGGGSGGGGLNPMTLLTNPAAMEGIGKIIQLWKGAPEQGQLARDFSLLFNGMKMGLNLKIAPEQIDELTKQFTDIGKGSQ